MDRIRCGFRIGYNYQLQSPRGIGATKNMRSVEINPQPVDLYIRDEPAAGRIIRLTEVSVATRGHVSRLSVIPKPHQPGKWRLITDLSSPKGDSVNDGVCPSLCSVSCASVDDAVRCIMRLGRGSLLAKCDIASAYRVVPVHPVDRLLLCMRWRGELLTDGALAFWLRSAPKLFTALADALLLVMGQHGVVHAMHYLDNFLVLGPPHSDLCQRHLDTSLDLCRHLGIPIAAHKLEGPAPVLSFLGILIDSNAGTLSLPPDTLSRLKQTIGAW